MSEPKVQHFVPACYLKHFAVPNDRYGRLHTYDRVAGRSFASSPDKSARERNFYNIEHREPKVVEYVYSALETRFAPVIDEVVERGILPTDSLLGRELLAFVANQAIRTPGYRKHLSDKFGQAHALALEAVADDKASFVKKLKQWCPEVTDEEAEECYETRREFVHEMKARGGAVDQTTLVVEALEIAAQVEDLLAQRYWFLAVAPDGTQFITSDEPIRLVPARRLFAPHARWRPSFEDPDTDVIVPLSTRLSMIGRSRPSDRARYRLDRRQVASFNTDVALLARRFVYSATATFAQIADDGSIIEGPTIDLQLVEPSRTGTE